jgi:septum formation protein
MLARLKIPFSVMVPEVDESPWLSRATRKTAELLARLKAEAAAEKLKHRNARWIISADTIVEAGGRVLGKPENEGEALSFLRLLSGRTHRVHTGIALIPCSGDPVASALCTTRVTFRRMTETELAFYAGTGEWRGVAGAYRIQERGGFFIEHIRGSYSNVVGLPLETLYVLLRKHGYCFDQTETSHQT